MDLITLWDSSDAPPAQGALVYCWNGHEEGGSVRSLLQYVETHSERLRSKYLALIHELGERRINGKRVIDHLALGNGLSYWWMTLLVEQSVFKSPSIADAIRVLAIEEILVRQRPAAFRLVSARRDLHEALSRLCRSLSVSYEWERRRERSRGRPSVVAVYGVLPKPVQALFSFALHVARRWPLRAAKNSGWLDGDGAVLFCSYFLHLDHAALAKGEFASQYWGELPSELAACGRPTNWLHHFVESSVAPSASVALEAVTRFNQQQPARAAHAFVDSYLSIGVVVRAVQGWVRLWFLSWRLRGIRSAFTPAGSRVSLWSLMRSDWDNSIRGPVAIKNLLWVELMGAALRGAPRQQQGLFLCENQGWERAFVHAWRANGHGRLIAVQHSTIRHWDLRYFIDPRSVQATGPHPMPRADIMALNGEAAMVAHLGSGYPQEEAAQSEALRYGYMNGLHASSASRKPGAATRVLILGDYVPRSTVKMLHLLEAAVRLSTCTAEYSCKPHPSYLVRSEDFPTLQMKIVTDPLPSILRQFDVAYASNMTSAAVDAYLTGLPVVVMLDESDLNFSPLRGAPGVRFVATPGELVDALEQRRPGGAADTGAGEFFFVDPALPRWRRLMGIA